MPPDPKSYYERLFHYTPPARTTDTNAIFMSRPSTVSTAETSTLTPPGAVVTSTGTVNATTLPSSSSQPQSNNSSNNNNTPWRWCWMGLLVTLWLAILAEFVLFLVALIRQHMLAAGPSSSSSSSWQPTPPPTTNYVQPLVWALYLGVLWLALVGSYSLVGWVAQNYCAATTVTVAPEKTPVPMTAANVPPPTHLKASTGSSNIACGSAGIPPSSLPMHWYSSPTTWYGSTAATVTTTNEHNKPRLAPTLVSSGGEETDYSSEDAEQTPLVLYMA